MANELNARGRLFSFMENVYKKYMILNQRHSCGYIHRNISGYRLLMAVLSYVYKSIALYSCVLA